MNECIICLESNGILVNNPLCSCECYYHIDCCKKWYIKTSRKTCIVCNKEISTEILNDMLGYDIESCSINYEEPLPINTRWYIDESKQLKVMFFIITFIISAGSLLYLLK